MEETKDKRIKSKEGKRSIWKDKVDEFEGLLSMKPFRSSVDFNPS